VRLALAALLLAGISGATSAQTPDPAAASDTAAGVGPGGAWLGTGLDTGVVIERIDVRRLPEVDVRFTVRDENGQWVQGLNPQEVSVRLDDDPIVSGLISSRFVDGDYLTVAFAVDISGSMRAALPEVRAAIADFASRLGEKDELGLVTFNETFSVPVPLDGDRDQVVAHLDSLAIRGNTAFYDALDGALDLLARSSNPRRTLVAVSDGSDNRSTVTLEAIGERANAEGIPVYAIALGAEADTVAMRELTNATGGKLVPISDPGDLRRLYSDLAGLLTNEYRLVFSLPGGMDERFHDVAIEVDAEGWTAKRPFLATKSPGVSRRFLGSRRAAAARSDLYRTWALIGLPALAAAFGGVLLVARTRRLPLSVGLLLLTTLLAISFSGFVALLWHYFGGSP